MPRASQPQEFNSFIGGLITEASPLTFPPNASLDEENFILNMDGSRERRLGLDFEAGAQLVDSGQAMPSGSLVTSFYKWSNVGGNTLQTFLVVQVQNVIMFFDANIHPTSAAQVGSWEYPTGTNIQKFSFASVDGKLVVVTGGKDVDVFTYGGEGDFTTMSKRLLVRDLFGVTDIAGS